MPVGQFTAKLLFTLGGPVLLAISMTSKSRSGKGRASSSARRRAKKAGARSTASSQSMKPRAPYENLFEDETSPGTQEAVIGAPDKPMRKKLGK
jgi:hypothetical protein